METMQIKTFGQFEKFLYSRIPSRSALFCGDIGLRRTEYLLKLLKNPQNKLKVIHIAGTSGKGSTAHFCSALLHAHGFKTGLQVSPHMSDVRERLQINGKLQSKEKVFRYFNEILPAIESMEKTAFGMPTYFEILVALAFHMFKKEGVDYAVMETGLGGLLDATNTVTNKNKLSIITKIGFDHTAILGKTLREIAFQKAAIIQNSNVVLSAAQHKNVYPVIEKMVEEKYADLSYVLKDVSYKNAAKHKDGNIFDFQFENLKLSDLHLAAQGAYQQENCALALACLAKIFRRDGFKFSEDKIREVLSQTMIPCRMEIFKLNGKTVIFDGAHNPQKMSALIRSLKKIYPDKKPDFLIACKKEKAYKEMLSEIIPLADKIYLTSFSNSKQDNPNFSKDPVELEKFLRDKNFKHFEIIDISQQEMAKFLKKTGDILVITGSFYLISEIRKILRK
jgi:dihydrofolate synthase/folylpolyglutamate synthase